MMDDVHAHLITEIVKCKTINKTFAKALKAIKKRATKHPDDTAEDNARQLRHIEAISDRAIKQAKGE